VVTGFFRLVYPISTDNLELEISHKIIVQSARLLGAEINSPQLNFTLDNYLSLPCVRNSGEIPLQAALQTLYFQTCISTPAI
jgi:hypothetical protein